MKIAGLYILTENQLHALYTEKFKLWDKGLKDILISRCAHCPGYAEMVKKKDNYFKGKDVRTI